MIKKILISLSVITAVTAIVVGATTALLNDEETSEGNTFTAGELNLKLDVDDQYYDGTNTVLFMEDDVKPGDSGEETLSLHIEGNDAYVCKYFRVSEDKENGCNEPEEEAEPNATTSCGDPGEDQGELDENMDLLIWEDDGDNVFENEPIIFQGKASDLANTLDLPDLEEIAGNTTTYIGIQWSVPTSTGNIIQGDSVKIDACFYAVQKRNNAGFDCPTTWPCQ